MGTRVLAVLPFLSPEVGGCLCESGSQLLLVYTPPCSVDPWKTRIYITWETCLFRSQDLPFGLLPSNLQREMMGQGADFGFIRMVGVLRSFIIRLVPGFANCPCMLHKPVPPHIYLCTNTVREMSFAQMSKCCPLTLCCSVLKFQHAF